MAKEIALNDMDKVMDRLENRVATESKVTIGRAIRIYYPKLAELKEKKGFSIRELYAACKEIFPEMEITQQTFASYWHRARMAHEKAMSNAAAKTAQQTGQAKPEAASVKASAPRNDHVEEATAAEPVRMEPVKAAEPAVQSATPEPDRTEPRRVSEPVRPAVSNHAATVNTEPVKAVEEIKVSEPAKPAVQTAISTPEPVRPAVSNHAETVKAEPSTAASQVRTEPKKPGWLTQEDIRARDQELFRRAAEKKAEMERQKAAMK